jgi:uncharacterized protein DUF4242
MAILVLEHTFDDPISDQALNDSAKRMDQCLEAYGARWIRSYLSKDRKRMICEFEAADAEQIRTSARAAGVPFDRCWVADLYSKDQPTASY